jgi:hypothetical protein
LSTRITKAKITKIFPQKKKKNCGLNCEERERDGGGEKKEEKPFQECFHQAQGGGSLSNNSKKLNTKIKNLKKTFNISIQAC